MRFSESQLCGSNRHINSEFSLSTWLALIMISAGILYSVPIEANGPHARLRSVPSGSAEWTGGFWGDRMGMVSDTMFPEMQKIMEGDDYSHYLMNFRIAAGEIQGRSRGAPFNDGDYYKWLQAACHLVAADRQSPEAVRLEREIDRIIEIIGKAQRDDGYIHTPVLIKAMQGDPEAVPFSDRHNFELYNMGHLFSTAATHFQVTGKTNLLEIAEKAADFLDRTFKDAPPEAARSSVCPSHYMGMVDLWRVTRKPHYLALVKKFFLFRSQISDGGDDNQDRIPFEDQTEAVGHAVRANYLYAGAADLYMETGEENFWKPLPLIWQNLVSRKIYITGGCGALYDGASPYGSKQQRSITRTHQAFGHNYELPNTTAHNETCASIGNILWNWRMFLITTEPQYLDLLEKALYNSVLAGADINGTNFFYTNPLRVTDPLPTDLRWSRTRVPYVSAFCCPPNLLRVIADSPNYAFAESDNTVWITLFGNSRLNTKINDNEIAVEVSSDYPWDGRTVITVSHQESSPVDMSLQIRIPGWTRSSQAHLYSVGEDEIKLPDPIPGQFLNVTRNWRDGDHVVLEFPMPVRLTEANPLVEETRNHLAIERGPLVYCLESPDLPEGYSIQDLYIDPSQSWTPRRNSKLFGGSVVLEGKLVHRKAQDWKNNLYREFSPSEPELIDTSLIPYPFWNNRGPSQMTVWMPVNF